MLHEVIGALNDGIMLRDIHSHYQTLKEKEEMNKQNDVLIKNVLKEKNEELHEMKEMMKHLLEKVKQ